jgi:hypothetical protein
MSHAPTRADEIVIVHTDQRVLMDLTAALAGMRYKVVAIDAVRSIRTAQRVAVRRPVAMIVELDGKENVAEIRVLTESAPETKFLFLVPDMPPRAAMARIINEHGSAILAQDEPAVVVVGTLVALLTAHSAETA